MRRFIKNETGQALVMVAVAMVVLMGFAALTVDLGMVHLTRAKMQNAADAAALAGAPDLPGGAAELNAREYADLNGAENTIVNTPYDGNAGRIEVICTKNVPYTFARVLGFTGADVSARAVGECRREWAGEALPFINLDDDYDASDQIILWEKTGPGDYERMWKESYQVFYENEPSKTHFVVDYTNGIMVTKGVDVEHAVYNVFNQGNPAVVYIFSLSSEVIRSGKYAAKNFLKNKTVIPLEDLVLIQAEFDVCEHKHLSFTVKNVYDINSGILPTEHLHSAGASKLVG